MTKYQVKYKDANDGTVVLAQHRTNNTDPDLDDDAIAQADRILITRQAQGQAKAKVWCDPSIIGNIKTKKSEYATALNGENEREILIEEYNGSSWDRIFRGKPKAKPSTDADGQALFILQGFSQQLGKEDVNFDSGGSTLRIDTILSNILPSGYTVNTAPAADFEGGSIPERENYRLIDEQRQIAFRELTKETDVSIIFTSDLSNGDYKVRLEPRGHGGTVDTIQGPRDKDSNGTLGLFREWEGENPETIINKVKVKGTDSTGEPVTDNNGNFPIVKDTTSINDYGVKFKSKNIPYVESFSEAQSIGNEILRPDPVPGGGVVKTPRFTSRVVNSSFDLKDSRNNVDAVYTAVKTRNYLHEQATELVFEYETASEADSENQVQTIYERNKLVENQTSNVTGNTTKSAIDSEYAFGKEINIALDDGDEEDVRIDAPSFSNGLDFAIISVHFLVGDFGDYEVEIQNDTSGKQIFQETIDNIAGGGRAVTVVDGDVSNNDTIDFDLTNNTGNQTTVRLIMTVDAIGKHIQQSDNMTAETGKENKTDR